MSEMIENPGMDRQKLETFILETYPASADRPWLQYPNYEVFRHSTKSSQNEGLTAFERENGSC